MRVIGEDGCVIDVPEPIVENKKDRHRFPLIKNPMLIAPVSVLFCCKRMKVAMVSSQEITYHIGHTVSIFGGANIDYCPWCGALIIILEE